MLQSSITKTLPKIESSDANVKLIWIHILTDLPALTLHGGRRRTCNIHRAYTKQHILLPVKPMKFMANPEKLWSHVWNGQGSSIIYVTHDTFWYIVSPSLHLILGNESECQRSTRLEKLYKDACAPGMPPIPVDGLAGCQELGFLSYSHLILCCTLLCPFSANPKLHEIQSNPAQRLCNPRIGAWTFPVAQDNGLQTVILMSHLIRCVAKLHHQTGTPWIRTRQATSV